MFSTGFSAPFALLVQLLLLLLLLLLPKLRCDCLTKLEVLRANDFLLFFKMLELTVSLAVVASSDSNFADDLEEQSPAVALLTAFENPPVPIDDRSPPHSESSACDFFGLHASGCVPDDVVAGCCLLGYPVLLPIELERVFVGDAL